MSADEQKMTRDFLSTPICLDKSVLTPVLTFEKVSFTEGELVTSTLVRLIWKIDGKSELSAYCKQTKPVIEVSGSVHDGEYFYVDTMSSIIASDRKAFDAASDDEKKCLKGLATKSAVRVLQRCVETRLITPKSDIFIVASGDSIKPFPHLECSASDRTAITELAEKSNLPLEHVLVKASAMQSLVRFYQSMGFKFTDATLPFLQQFLKSPTGISLKATVHDLLAAEQKVST